VRGVTGIKYQNRRRTTRRDENGATIAEPLLVQSVSPLGAGVPKRINEFGNQGSPIATIDGEGVRGNTGEKFGRKGAPCWRLLGGFVRLGMG